MISVKVNLRGEESYSFTSKKGAFMWKKSLLILGFILLQVSLAQAQGVSIGPQLSYQRANDADEGKFMVGGALRMRLTPALGAEASVNYREEDYSDGGVTVRSWPVMVTGFIYPLPMVYGAIGAGWYNAALDYDQGKPQYQNTEDKTTQEVGWHFGGGLELPASSSTRITADIRYVFLDYNFEQVPGSNAINSDFYVVTFGVLFDL